MNRLPLRRGAAIGQGVADEERCMTHIGHIPLSRGCAPSRAGWEYNFCDLEGLTMLMCCLCRRPRDHEEPEARETASRAMEILKVRFARGEIDKAEFEEKRKLILE